MNKIKLKILITCLLCVAFSSSAETLTLEACREAACKTGQNARLNELTEEEHESRNSLTKRQYTPRIGFSAEAHYQSDAPDPTGLTDFPFELYKLDKFGYHAGFTLMQSIYRGGTLKIEQEINTLNEDISQLETQSETYALENVVDDVYLDIILAGKQQEIARTQQTALTRKLQDAEEAFEQGSGYKSGIIAIEAAIAGIEASIEGYATRRRSGIAILSELTGLDISESTVFETPRPGVSRDFPDPAFKGLDLQIRKLSAQKQLEIAKMRPSLNAFGTVGYGNWPLDIFKRQPDFYGIAGISLTIPLSSLQDASIRGRILDSNAEKLRIRKENLEKKQIADNLKYDGEIARLDAMISAGELTVSKYEELCKELERMSESGISSYSDYIDALDKLSAARIDLEVYGILKIRTQLQKNRNLLK